MQKFRCFHSIFNGFFSTKFWVIWIDLLWVCVVLFAALCYVQCSLLDIKTWKKESKNAFDSDVVIVLLSCFLYSRSADTFCNAFRVRVFVAQHFSFKQNDHSLMMFYNDDNDYVLSYIFFPRKINNSGDHSEKAVRVKNYKRGNWNQFLW